MMHFSKRLLPEILLVSLLSAGGASAQIISIVSGDGQVSTQNNAALNPMIVVVRNAQGQPVPGTPVTWTVNGQGTIIGGFTTTTDANGMSSNMFLGATLFNLSFTQTIIIASAAGSSVSFTETTSGLDPTSTASLVQAAVTYPGLGTVLSGSSGSVGSTPVQIQVFSTGISGGQGLANVLIRLIPANGTGGPQIACSGNTGYTNSMGNTNCLPVFSGTPGTSQYTIDVGGGYRTFGPYSFTVMPGNVAAFRITGGNNQSGAPGATVALPLTAQTQDAAGNPLPNVPVTWTVLNNPNSATITSSSSASDANGNVSATVKLGSIIGPVQIQLNSPQGGTAIVFTLQVNLQVTGVTTIAGDNQDAIINTNYAQPLVVQVNSSQGPGAGVQVQFTSIGAIPVLFPSGSTATAGSNGQASVAVQAGPSAGTATVTASAGGFTATFTLTIRPPGPAITTSSFFSAAGGLPGGITPASLVAIYGAGIATGLQGCVSGPEAFGAQPLLVGGDTVLFNEGSFSAYGPILSVCNLSGQEYLVVQIPAELPLGAASVTVRAGIGTKTVDGVLVTPANPGVFETVMSDGQKRALLQHLDGTFVSLESKAQRGEKLRAYVTGLGRPVSASGVLIGTNQSGIAGDDAAPQVPVIAGVADEGVAVDSAVYSTDLIGVYIVTFVVPSDVPSGNNLDFGMAVNLNGNLTFSNASKIPVQ